VKSRGIGVAAYIGHCASWGQGAMIWPFPGGAGINATVSEETLGNTDDGVKGGGSVKSSMGGGRGGVG
jgi:hypothetical protein